MVTKVVLDLENELYAKKFKDSQLMNPREI